jgi:hypothetical protein
MQGRQFLHQLNDHQLVCIDLGACLLSAEWLAIIWPTREKYRKKKMNAVQEIMIFLFKGTVQKNFYILTKKIFVFNSKN